MARYYFHVRGGAVEAIDDLGSDFDDELSARAEAVRAARELLASAVLAGNLPLGERIDVEDAARCPVFSLTFAASVGVDQSGMSR